MKSVNDPRASVVVTGAARGIGQAIAEALAEAGWAVVGVDLDPGTATGSAMILGDVSQRATHDAAAVAASAIAPLEAWVNNAAVSIGNDLHVRDEGVLRRVVDTNLVGVYHGCAAAVTGMLEQRSPGSIVNISSIHARAGFAGWAAYETAKGGVESLTRHVAAAYGSHGIRANAVSPGTISTPNLDEHLQRTRDPAATRRHLAAAAPLQRLGEPREVAELVMFLVSERASYITGAVIPVDGGLSAITEPPRRPGGPS